MSKRAAEFGRASSASRMFVSLDLLINAIVAGLLLGGFYAAVTVGVSISFGMLDIVNIAHPAFIILGSYIAYIVNTALRHRPDPGRHRRCCRRSTLLGVAVYQVYYVAFERRGRPVAARPGVLLRPAVHHRGGAGPDLRRRLPLRRGAAISAPPAFRLHRPAVADAGAVRGLAGDDRRAAALPVAHLHRPRDHGGGAGPAGAAADGGRSRSASSASPSASRSPPRRWPARS